MLNRRGTKRPSDGAARQQAYRDRLRAKGRVSRLYYLTDEEKARIDSVLDDMRGSKEVVTIESDVTIGSND